MEIEIWVTETKTHCITVTVEKDVTQEEAEWLLSKNGVDMEIADDDHVKLKGVLEKDWMYSQDGDYTDVEIKESK